MGAVVLRERVSLAIVDRGGEDHVRFTLPIGMVIEVPVSVVEPQATELLTMLASKRQSRGELRPLVSYWLETPAQFSIVNGIATCALTSACTAFEFKSTVATMQAGMANAALAWGEHQARNGAQVVKLGERGPAFIREFREP